MQRIAAFYRLYLCRCRLNLRKRGDEDQIIWSFKTLSSTEPREIIEFSVIIPTEKNSEVPKKERGEPKKENEKAKQSEVELGGVY